jgi:protein-S-isoprenylcysteine O-methyltransferase Ste14
MLLLLLRMSCLKRAWPISGVLPLATPGSQYQVLKGLDVSCRYAGGSLDSAWGRQHLCSCSAPAAADAAAVPSAAPGPWRHVRHPALCLLLLMLLLGLPAALQLLLVLLQLCLFLQRPPARHLPCFLNPPADSCNTRHMR